MGGPACGTRLLNMGADRLRCKSVAAREKSQVARLFYPKRRRTRYNQGTSKKDWTNRAMNVSPEMDFDEMLSVKLEVLRREHRDLDEAVRALELSGRPDVLTLRRLKKQKLAMKDQITRIENKLIPDIIA